MSKVSVIIPLYNVEQYVEQCFESLVNQTYKNLEIICVNDASNDNSIDIVKKYAQNDERIQIITHEKNRSVSAARNTGLDYASGDYVCFLDSDDWIENDYIEKMVEKIDETKADIVINRHVISVKGTEQTPFNAPSGQYDIPDETFINKERDTHNIFVAVWTKILKQDFIKKYNLKFPEGYIYEDIYYHYTTIANTDKIYFFNGSPYYYRKNESSLSSQMIKDSEKIITVFELIYDYYKKHNLLNSKIKIYYTFPQFNVDNENTYRAFKNYFSKAGNYILENDIYNDMDKFFCKNILNTETYNDYIKKFPSNAAISYVRRNKNISYN